MAVFSPIFMVYQLILANFQRMSKLLYSQRNIVFPAEYRIVIGISYCFQNVAILQQIIVKLRYLSSEYRTLRMTVSYAILYEKCAEFFEMLSNCSSFALAL